MSEPIGPGDYVECINSSKPANVGRVYLVTRVFVERGGCPCHGGSPFGLRFAEKQPTRRRKGFCGLNYRPIYRRDESLIERLLAPLPAEPDLVPA
jgi:hypothetical protein